jgi:hypothetical protein
VLAGIALDKSDLVTVHALERYQLRGEVVPVDGLLTAVTHGAGQESVAAAHLAGSTGVRALQQGNDLR